MEIGRTVLVDHGDEDDVLHEFLLVWPVVVRVVVLVLGSHTWSKQGVPLYC